MDSLDSNRALVSQIFSDKSIFTKPAGYLATLESLTEWFFVMDLNYNISKFKTLEALNRFARMAMADIRSGYSDVRQRFFKLYRFSSKTRSVLEANFAELREFNISAPVGNPRHWKDKFIGNTDRVCELLARDRTNYGLLMLPHTETDLRLTSRRATQYATGVAEDPLMGPGDVNIEPRLLYSAYAFMDVYVHTHRDRWMKFFEYLITQEKTELLNVWYP